MNIAFDEKQLESAAAETVELIEQLCGVPAPSNMERNRAEFCRDWFEKNGAQGVYIDSADNVIYPVNCDGREDIVVFMAHTDTVFPDTEPMKFVNDGTYLHSPGVGDDTACLAIMMTVVKQLIKQGATPKRGIIFAANSGEEGLGNLRGIRQIMKDYGGRISEVYTFDGQYNAIVNKCVGSHRYKVTAETEGGHSFNAFGNANAICELSKLICRLCSGEVPHVGNSKTTYNVGVINGGTSVNTIAQSAEMLYEYRSDSAECIGRMQQFFEEAVAAAKAEGKAAFEVEVLGIRPCGGDVDEKQLAEMSRKVADICEKHSGVTCEINSGSTDCNIPMSLGVPAVCVGLYLGGGEHTREEKVLIGSIPVGLKIAAELIGSYM